ncbi:hypothetical protein PAMH27_0524 [Pseudomonas aeruginosa MH27]|nr:hypothetical protein PAMH27_0524 [Pseudomonas aeruginosa MH27]
MGVSPSFGQAGPGFQPGLQAGCQGFEAVRRHRAMVDQEQRLPVVVQGHHHGAAAAVVAYGQVTGAVERGFEGPVAFQQLVGGVEQQVRLDEAAAVLLQSGDEGSRQRLSEPGL